MRPIQHNYDFVICEQLRTPGAFKRSGFKFFFIHLLPFILIICSLVMAGCSKTVNRKIPPTLDAAELAGLSGEPPKESILDKSPEHLVTSGFNYVATGSPALARLHFQAALQKEPALAKAFFGLGQVEFDLGNYAGAALFFRKAAEIEPGNIPALVGGTRALRRANKLDAAEATLLRAMEIAPDNQEVLSERAILHDLQGNEELATPIYRQLLERNPKQATTLNNLGVNRLLNQTYGDAIVYFRQALLLDHNNPKIKNNLATAYALNGDEQKALQLFTETVGKAAAYNNLGYLYLTIGRLDAAEQALSKALELNPRFYTRAQKNLDLLELYRSPTP